MGRENLRHSSKAGEATVSENGDWRMEAKECGLRTEGNKFRVDTDGVLNGRMAACVTVCKVKGIGKTRPEKENLWGEVRSVRSRQPCEMSKQPRPHSESGHANKDILPEI